MNNKIICLLLAISLCFCLTACGGTQSSKKDTKSKEKSSNNAADSSSENESNDDIFDKKTVASQYEIYNALTVFNEGRAWAKYINSDNEYTYAIIDKKGREIWSIVRSELKGVWKNELEIKASKFENGVSCLYNTEYANDDKTLEGMLVINKNGKVLFDSRDAAEGTKYRYLGYGNGVILLLENVASFSDNSFYICEMNNSGKIVSRTKIDSEPMLILSYAGDGIFYSVHDIYNQSTKALFHQESAIELINIAKGEFVYRNHKVTISALANSDAWESFCDRINDEKTFSDDIVWASEGIIMQRSYEDYRLSMYDHNGVKLGSLPEEWNDKIDSVSELSNGYAGVRLNGADGKTYVTVVDKYGKPQYDLIKVDSCDLPAWHGYLSVKIGGKDVILDPKGRKTTIDEIDKKSQDYTIGYTEVHNGYMRIRVEQNGYLPEGFTGYSDVKGNVLDTVYIMK